MAQVICQSAQSSGRHASKAGPKASSNWHSSFPGRTNQGGAIRHHASDKVGPGDLFRAVTWWQRSWRKPTCVAFGTLGCINILGCCTAAAGRNQLLLNSRGVAQLGIPNIARFAQPIASSHLGPCSRTLDSSLRMLTHHGKQH